MSWEFLSRTICKYLCKIIIEKGICLVTSSGKNNLKSLQTTHYWKTVLCRVPETLPSAFYRDTRQRKILPSAALGKIKHSAKVALPSAMHSAKPGSRQI